MDFLALRTVFILCLLESFDPVDGRGTSVEFVCREHSTIDTFSQDNILLLPPLDLFSALKRVLTGMKYGECLDLKWISCSKSIWNCFPYFENSRTMCLMSVEPDSSYQEVCISKQRVINRLCTWNRQKHVFSDRITSTIDTGNITNYVLLLEDIDEIPTIYADNPEMIVSLNNEVNTALRPLQKILKVKAFNVTIVCPSKCRNILFELLLQERHASSLSNNTNMYISGSYPKRHNMFPNNLSNERTVFQNRTLIAAVLDWPPFVIKTTRNGSAVYSGISINILDHLSHRLNFSYKLVEPPDNEWGRVVDGQWTGLVGMMAYRTADLVIAPLIMEASREDVMDFTMPYFYDQYSVLVKTANIEDIKWKTFMVLFRWEVLVCIFVCMLASSALVFSFDKFSLGECTVARSGNGFCAFGDILQYHFGALMANGGDYTPQSISSRTVLVFWWFFTVITAAVYRGNLIAFLADWRQDPPFSSLDEMVQQEGYRWGFVEGGFLTALFKNSNISEFRQVWDGLKTFQTEDPEVVTGDYSVHLRKVLEGNYAYIGDVSMMKMWQTQHCKLQRLQDQLYLTTYAIGLQNNSEYKKIFSSQILQIYESGFIDIWNKQLMPKHHFCDVDKSAKRVDILSLFSVFLFAGVGVLAAAVVLVIEMLIRGSTVKTLKEKVRKIL